MFHPYIWLLRYVAYLFYLFLINSVTYMRLDGSVVPEKRFEIVKAFNSDPTIDVLLLTTHGMLFPFNNEILLF